MPIVRLTTTLKQAPEGIEARLATLINKLFPWKELSHCFIMVQPGTKIYNSLRCPTGTEPLALLEIQSMSTFTPENVGTSRTAFMDFVSTELNIEKSRILVAFTDVPANFAGIGE